MLYEKLTKVKSTTQHLLKRKWTGSIDKSGTFNSTKKGICDIISKTIICACTGDVCAKRSTLSVFYKALSISFMPLRK